MPLSLAKKKQISVTTSPNYRYIVEWHEDLPDKKGRSRQVLISGFIDSIKQVTLNSIKQTQFVEVTLLDNCKIAIRGTDIESIIALHTSPQQLENMQENFIWQNIKKNSTPVTSSMSF